MNRFAYNPDQPRDYHGMWGEGGNPNPNGGKGKLPRGKLDGNYVRSGPLKDARDAMLKGAKGKLDGPYRSSGPLKEARDAMLRGAKSKFGRNIVAEFKRQIMPKPAVNGGGKGC